MLCILTLFLFKFILNTLNLVFFAQILKGDNYVSLANLADLINKTMSWEQCRATQDEEISNQCVMTIISDGKSEFFQTGKIYCIFPVDY